MENWGVRMIIKLEEWEYGTNKMMLYTLILNMRNPVSGIPLALTDLYVRMHVRGNLDDDPLFSVVGVLNDDTSEFEFGVTQDQADLLILGTWYFGMETRLTDVTGQVLKRETFSRKIKKTGAKE